MDWDLNGARVLCSGKLLKTAVGKKQKFFARTDTAKIRFCRLVVHEKFDGCHSKAPQYVLYYHDTEESEVQKGKYVINAYTTYHDGWNVSNKQEQIKFAAANNARAKNEIASQTSLAKSFPTRNRSASALLPPRRKSGSGANTNTLGTGSRLSSGNLAQAIASTASRQNSFHIENEDRMLFLMVIPGEGKDRAKVVQVWKDAIEVAREAARNAMCTKPTSYTTVTSVHFDTTSQKFSGVPENLANDFAKAVFNLSLSQQTLVHIDGYETGIPRMLVMLMQCLLTLGGEKVHGIFRIAPAKDECEKAKRTARLQNHDDLKRVSSPHIFSTLIKQWFRDLPGGLLNE